MPGEQVLNPVGYGNLPAHTPRLAIRAGFGCQELSYALVHTIEVPIHVGPILLS